MNKDSAKTYVLDTDVLLSTPFSIFSFDEHNVVLADASIEDLNIAKNWSNEQGRNAREVLKMLDELCCCGNIIERIELPNEGTLRIHCQYSATPIPMSWDANGANSGRTA